MYEVGELSMMIVSRRSRPTWERSCGFSAKNEVVNDSWMPYLDIVPLMIITTVPKQSMMDNIMDV